MFTGSDSSTITIEQPETRARSEERHAHPGTEDRNNAGTAPQTEEHPRHTRPSAGKGNRSPSPLGSVQGTEMRF